MIELIWIKFHQLLLKFITAKVSDPIIAEDILQDVFISVVKNINHLEDTSKLQAWLYQICRNKITDYYRTKKIDMVSIEACEELEADELHDNSDELTKCIQILIADLPLNVSAILQASEIDNIKQKDIATNENISISALKSRLRRGRTLLKKKLIACCAQRFSENRVDDSCKNQCGCQS